MRRETGYYRYSMSDIRKQPISAQVALKPNAAANISEVTKQLQSAGLTVSDSLANNFAVSATPEVFERFFNVHLDVSSTGGVRVKGATGKTAFELPLDALSEELKGNIHKILFTRLPDFGPGSF